MPNNPGLSPKAWIQLHKVVAQIQINIALRKNVNKPKKADMPA